MKEDITSSLGVPCEIKNGRREVEYCAESGFWVVNEYFIHKNVYKCTRVMRNLGVMEIMSMINLVLVKRDI